MIGMMLAHYHIIRKLGQGGMGEVYLAEDTRLKRQVALKVLPEALRRDPEQLRRFRTEAEAAAKLNHPNIATIYSIEEMEWSRERAILRGGEHADGGASGHPVGLPVGDSAGAVHGGAGGGHAAWEIRRHSRRPTVRGRTASGWERDNNDHGGGELGAGV
ncbi:MAG: protein kinase [Candidatus Latescibacteria bacterium]|nr:protein kinase [Candidatus Latescibacterota bacterium]